MIITGKRGLGVLLLAVVLVTTAACGSAKPKTAPNTPDQIKADRAIAKQALLTLSDLPSGYKGSPHKHSSGNDIPPKVEAKFIACTHIPKRLVDNTNDDQPSADAPDFTKGDVTTGPTSEIDSSVEIDRSSKDISEPIDLLAQKGTAACFQPFFHAAIAQALKGEKGVSLGVLTVKSVSSGDAGDQGVGFQGRVDVVGPAATIPFYFDMFFVRSGRALVELSGNGTREPVGLDFEHQLLATMLERLKNTT
jgi:hypothetical protein